jgi:hypothetical protein
MASASGISGAHRLASIAQVASITARRQRDRFVVIGFAPDGAGGLAKLRAGRRQAGLCGRRQHRMASRGSAPRRAEATKSFPGRGRSPGGNGGRSLPPQRLHNSMTNARASIPAESPGTRPELRLPNTAAQTRIVSVARIRLDSRKSVRPFKGIICSDISEFESYMPSHAVRSLPAKHAGAMFMCCNKAGPPRQLWRIRPEPTSHTRDIAERSVVFASARSAPGSLCISLSPVRTAFRGGSTRKNGRQQL